MAAVPSPNSNEQSVIQPLVCAESESGLSHAQRDAQVDDCNHQGKNAFEGKLDVHKLESNGNVNQKDEEGEDDIIDVDGPVSDEIESSKDDTDENQKKLSTSDDENKAEVVPENSELTGNSNENVTSDDNAAAVTDFTEARNDIDKPREGSPSSDHEVSELRRSGAASSTEPTEQASAAGHESVEQMGEDDDEIDVGDNFSERNTDKEERQDTSQGEEESDVIDVVSQGDDTGYPSGIDEEDLIVVDSFEDNDEDQKEDEEQEVAMVDSQDDEEKSSVHVDETDKGDAAANELIAVVSDSHEQMTEESQFDGTGKTGVSSEQDKTEKNTVEDVADESGLPPVADISESVDDDVALADEPEIRESVDDDVALADEPGVRESVDDDAALADEPENRESVDDDAALADEPDIRESVDDDVALADEPGVRESVDDDAALADEPENRESVDDDAALADEPENRESVDDDKALADEPENRQSVDDDKALADEPDIRESVGDDAELQKEHEIMGGKDSIQEKGSDSKNDSSKEISDTPRDVDYLGNDDKGSGNSKVMENAEASDAQNEPESIPETTEDVAVSEETHGSGADGKDRGDQVSSVSDLNAEQEPEVPMEVTEGVGTPPDENAMETEDAEISALNDKRQGSDGEMDTAGTLPSDDVEMTSKDDDKQGSESNMEVSDGLVTGVGEEPRIAETSDVTDGTMPQIVEGSVTSMPCILEGSVTSYSDLEKQSDESATVVNVNTETASSVAGGDPSQNKATSLAPQPKDVEAEVTPMEIDEADKSTAGKQSSDSQVKQKSSDDKKEDDEDDDLIVVGETDKNEPVEIIDLIEDENEEESESKDKTEKVKEKSTEDDGKRSESGTSEKRRDSTQLSESNFTATSEKGKDSSVDSRSNIAQQSGRADTTESTISSSQLNINQSRSRNISDIISKIVQQKQTIEESQERNKEAAAAETSKKQLQSLPVNIKIKDEPVDTNKKQNQEKSSDQATVNETAAKNDAQEKTKRRSGDPELEITQVITTGKRAQPSCSQCKQVKTLTQTLDWNRQRYRFCCLSCMDQFARKNALRIDKSSQGSQPATRTCGYCKSPVAPANASKWVKNLSGRILHFCSQTCLIEINQRMKTCSHCSKELVSSSDIIMAQVGNQNGFKEFCSQECVGNFEAKKNKIKNDEVLKKCSVCEKMGQVKHEVNFQGQVHKLCSDSCFAAFRYAHNLSMNCCDQCGVNCYNDRFTPQYMQYEGKPKRFCTLKCLNRFKEFHKRFVDCFWCKTRKNNFEMVERVDSNNKVQLFCSLPCLQAYREKVSSVSATPVSTQPQAGQPQPQKLGAPVGNASALCNHCKKMSPPLFHLTMSDNSIRNFCSYNCVIAFQAQFNTPTVTLPHQTLQLQCSLCKMNFSSKPVILEYKGTCNQFCSQPCLEDFKRINAVTAVCDTCHQEKILYETCKFSGQDRSFCSEGCKLLFKQDFTKGLGLKCIVCDYCSQMGKASCDKIFDGKKKQFCKYSCRDRYELWYNQAARCDGCRQQGRRLEESFMWRGEMKHVCSQQCLLLFYTQQNVPNLTTQMQPKLSDTNHVTGISSLANNSSTPIIASVMSLAPGQPNQFQSTGTTFNKTSSLDTVNTVATGNKPYNTRSAVNNQSNSSKVQMVAHPTLQNTIVLKSNQQTASTKTASVATGPPPLAKLPPLPKLDPPPPPPPPPKILKNKSLMCKPFTQTKATSCKPHQSSKSTNTDGDWRPKLVVVPIPVPIYVPVPMQMYSSVVPAPVVTPLPVPVPMWVPVASNNTDKLMKTMEEIKEKTPSDPLEAELLLMAEAIAGEEAASSQKDEDEQFSMQDDADDVDTGNLTFEETEQVIPSQMLEDDILQMAANIAQVISEPDHESDFTQETTDFAPVDFEEKLLSPREQRARARARAPPRNTRSSRRRGRGRKKAKVVEPEPEEVEPSSPESQQQTTAGSSTCTASMHTECGHNRKTKRKLQKATLRINLTNIN
ncbi:zinc finger MYM-type protein 4-like isoform X2 [Ptychodera flava]|uniref:zinc finger MYM-type protein 4-like isoform X2 n=1 Tax=Ptychodera flava TaxID=63121 RepID=UPI003969F3AC